jgi:pilus assembly protein CpaB
MDMKAHTPVTTEMVVPLGSNGDIPSFEIPVGKVAVALPMDKLTSVAYGLQKGDHVNVIVLLKLLDLDTNFQSKLPNKSGSVVAPGPAAEGAANTITATITDGGGTIGRIEIDPTINNPVLAIPSEPQRPRLVSQTLIQDAMVLQMGTFSLEAGQPTPQAQPTAVNRNQQAAEPTPTPVVPDVVTIVVDPQDAVSLNYLMLAGAKLSFALRSAGDTTLKDTEAATLQFILDQYRVPNPAKLPYGVEPVAPTPEPPTSTTVK